MMKYIFLICLISNFSSFGNEWKIKKSSLKGDMSYVYPSQYIAAIDKESKVKSFGESYRSPDGKCLLSFSDYGYIPQSESLKHSSSKDYIFLYEMVNKKFIKTIDMGNYEIFISSFKSGKNEGLYVIYRLKTALWGNCYDTMSFQCPIGTIDKYEGLLNHIIKNISPSLDLNKEQFKSNFRKGWKPVKAKGVSP